MKEEIMKWLSLLTSVLSVTPALVFGQYYGIESEIDPTIGFLSEEGSYKSEMNSIHVHDSLEKDGMNRIIFEHANESNEEESDDDYYEI